MKRTQGSCRGACPMAAELEEKGLCETMLRTCGVGNFQNHRVPLAKTLKIHGSTLTMIERGKWLRVRQSAISSRALEVVGFF